MERQITGRVIDLTRLPVGNWVYELHCYRYRLIIGSGNARQNMINGVSYDRVPAGSMLEIIVGGHPTVPTVDRLEVVRESADTPWIAWIIVEQDTER